MASKSEVGMKIVSGGQTGADRGGLLAAIDLELEWGGWAPKGFLAEDGRVPIEFNKLQEMDSGSYPARTLANILDSNATIIFTKLPLSGGSLLTFHKCQEWRKPVMVVDVDAVEDEAILERVKALRDEIDPQIAKITQKETEIAQAQETLRNKEVSIAEREEASHKVMTQAHQFQDDLNGLKTRLDDTEKKLKEREISLKQQEYDVARRETALRNSERESKPVSAKRSGKKAS